jgi:hypothetical protein
VPEPVQWLQCALRRSSPSLTLMASDRFARAVTRWNLTCLSTYCISACRAVIFAHLHPSFRRIYQIVSVAYPAPSASTSFARTKPHSNGFRHSRKPRQASVHVSTRSTGSEPFRALSARRPRNRGGRLAVYWHAPIPPMTCLTCGSPSTGRRDLRSSQRGGGKGTAR